MLSRSKEKFAGCVSCIGAFCPMTCAAKSYAIKEENWIKIGINLRILLPMVLSKLVFLLKIGL